MSTGDLHDTLLRLFARHDPLDLVHRGAPGDEYEPEVAVVIAYLDTTHNVQGVRWLVYRVMRAFFKGVDIGPEENYQALAQDVWDAWQQSHKEKTS